MLSVPQNTKRTDPIQPERQRDTTRRGLVEQARKRGNSPAEVKAYVKEGLEHYDKAKSSRRKSSFYRAVNKTFGFLDKKKLKAVRKTTRKEK